MDSTQPPKPTFRHKLRRWQIILVIVLLAAVLRLWAAWQLPLDADEPVYLKAGSDYASLIKSNDLAGILNYEGNREHPVLVKLVYAVPYLIFEPKFGSMAELYFNRVVSVVFGTLAVLVLALIDPLAGAFLALDSMVIKYTSEVYLEAIPLCFSLFSIYCILRSRWEGSSPVWFWISAFALGVAGAGKYLYVFAGIPILVLLIRDREKFSRMALFAVVALAGFFAFNPILWLDPLNRLWQSVTYFARYTQGSDVIRANYPWYQVVNWISAPVPWHANVFFFPTSDVLIFLFLFLGILRAVKEQLWALVWMGVVFLVLLFYPTKWPQYTLTLIPAMSLMASLGVKVIVDRIKAFDATWHWSEVVLPRPGKLFWIGLGLFLATLLTGKIWYEVDLAKARAGWIQVQEGISPLPSNTINDLALAADGRIVMATGDGVVFWKPDLRSPWGGSAQVFTTANSGLVNDTVRCLVVDPQGQWWFGTQSGLSRLAPDGSWRAYRAPELDLESDEILALTVDEDGALWIGSKTGAAVLRSGQNQAEAIINPSFPTGSIFAIAVKPMDNGQAVWFATQNGVTRLELPQNEWRTFDLSAYGIGWQGVSDLFVDLKGDIWAATLGDGISKWDGKDWTTFRTSNSGIPGNNITRIFQPAGGTLWLGGAYSTEPGGYLASFDQQQWQVFSNANSGFSGGEPTAMIIDEQQKLWIGTKVNGLNIYSTQK